MKQREKVAILGDSVTRGIIINEKKQYRPSKQLDWLSIEEKLNIQIVNFSHMGWTIARGKEKLLHILKEESDIHAMLIEYGGNDSDYDWQDVASVKSKKYTPKTSLEQFKAYLIEIIRMIQNYNIKPILMTLPPIDAKRYFDWITKTASSDNILYFLGDVDVIYRRQELYSNAILKIAFEEKVDLIDVREAFLKKDNFPNLLCEDGIHPNGEGQNLIIECFIEYYQKTRQ